MSVIFRKLQVNNLLLQFIRTTTNAPASDNTPVFEMENPFEEENQNCILCKTKVPVDYKNVKLLSQFQSAYTGKIYGRHITGLCKNQQEIVEREIMKAQNAGLMPTYTKDSDFLADPKLYDVDNPIRPHRF